MPVQEIEPVIVLVLRAELLPCGDVLLLPAMASIVSRWARVELH